MRVLVTGATGVLGRRVLPRLAAADHEITAVARGQHDKVRAAGATPIELDLFDADALRDAADGHDTVLDLATRIPPTSKMILPWAWKDNDRLRRDASHNVASAAMAVGARYVRESVCFVYADGADGWVDEHHPVAPVTYNRTALDAERAAHRVTDAGGVGVALRFAQFYGHDAVHTRDLISAARRGIAPVLGAPQGFTSQVHLDDAAAAVVAALDVPPGIYNVVEDEPARRAEFVRILEDLIGRTLVTPPAFLGSFGPAKAVARSLRLNNERLQNVSSWRPDYPTPRDGWSEVVARVRASVS